MKKNTLHKSLAGSPWLLLACLNVIALLAALKIVPPKVGLVLFCLLVSTIVLTFSYVLYLNLTREPISDQEKEKQFLLQNTSFPNPIFKSSPALLKRLYSYFMTLALAYLLILSLSFSVIAFLFLFSMLFFVLLLTGYKFISYIKFTASGILFYTRLYSFLGFGGKFFLPYEKCRIGFITGSTRIRSSEGLIFSSGHLPYVFIEMSSWKDAWQEIKDELSRRLPQTHFQ